MKRAILLAALALASIAMANPAIERGGLLTDPEGRTLYIFEPDQPGKSNCNSACTFLWFPYRAATSDRAAGQFSIVERSDGIRQWAFDGRPLYLYKGDVRPRDAKGDMPGWPWHVVRLDHKTDQPQESGDRMSSLR